MQEKLLIRLYRQTLLNRAYLRTILANQCIILSNQSGGSKNHKDIYQLLHKEVFNQFKQIVKEDKNEADGRL